LKAASGLLRERGNLMKEAQRSSRARVADRVGYIMILSGKMDGADKTAGESIPEGENGIEMPSWSKYPLAPKSHPHQHPHSIPARNPYPLLPPLPNPRLNMLKV